jgi:hypothetical protein
MSTIKFKSPEINHRKLKLEYEYKKDLSLKKGIPPDTPGGFFLTKLNNEFEFFKLPDSSELGIEMVDLSYSKSKEEAENHFKEPCLNKDFKNPNVDKDYKGPFPGPTGN